MAEKQQAVASVWRLAAADRKHFLSRVQLLDYRCRMRPWLQFSKGRHIFRLLLYQPKEEECPV